MEQELNAFLKVTALASSTFEMEQELNAFLKVTALASSTFAYARFASSITKPGKLRLLSLLPIILFLPSLPFYFSTLHLRIAYAFFLSWLATFKLLLLSVGMGPLSPSLSLITFIATASLPLKLQPSPTKPSPLFRRLIIPSIVKIFLLEVLLSLYQLKHRIPYFLLLSCYNLHLYLSVDLLLTSSAFIAGALLAINIDPQFNAPLSSSSPQEFWGHRWNLMVTDILRPSVYYPIKSRYGREAGTMAAFVVSGIMHEVLYLMLRVDGPRGEAFCFFVLQGLFTVAEGRGRRGAWWRVKNPMIGAGVTVGFVMVTSSCLLLRPLIRSGIDVRVVEESRAVMEFFLGGAWGVLRWLWSWILSLA